MNESPRVLVVGGGSGGHISPGLAVAEALAEMGGSCRFLCASRAVDRTMLGNASADFEALPAAPFITTPRGLVRCGYGMARSSRRVRRILRETDFDCVLALGGFVSASALPGLIASRRRPDGRRRPLVLLNLDRVPGKANRRVAARADLILSAVETRTSGFASRITGLPIRRAALADRSPEACREALGLDRDRPVLLITGASQGASSLNRLMRRLLERGWPVADSKSLQIIHLTGADVREPLADRYAAANVRAMVVPFLDAMGLAWGAASLTISRAGANSVGEIEANAVPAIFLPYPHHRDRHQYHNAAPLVASGGARMVDDRDDADTAEAVGRCVTELLADASGLRTMRQALASHARPEAARTVAACLNSA